MAAAPKGSREVPISEFKARCLSLVERVRKGRGEIVITKHGRPVAKVVALEDKQAWPPLGGSWAGRIKVVGDIVNTDWSDEFDTLAEWDELERTAQAAVKYLVDTHIVVWWLMGDQRLDAARRSLLDAEIQGMKAIAISDLTLWEIALLGGRGRLQITGTVDAFLAHLVAHPAVTVLSVDHGIALDAVRLPATFPRDPADRIIAATARSRGLTLVTQDRAIVASGAVATA